MGFSPTYDALHLTNVKQLNLTAPLDYQKINQPFGHAPLVNNPADAW